MSLITLTLATFETAKRLAPGAVVVVSYKGREAAGLRNSSSEESSPSSSGNKSSEIGSIQVARPDIDRPIIGECIQIDGKEAFVTNCEPDFIGAIYVISYQTTKPMEKEGV